MSNWRSGPLVIPKLKKPAPKPERVKVYAVRQDGTLVEGCDPETMKGNGQPQEFTISAEDYESVAASGKFIRIDKP